MYNATYTENKLLTIFWRGSVTSRAYYLGGNNMIGFGEISKRQAKNTDITAVTDTRLLKIDPQEKGFFDNVLNFMSDSDNEDINAFIEAISEVKDANLKAFYRPRYDPFEVSDHMVAYQKGKKPAVGHSHNWWVKTALKMPAVEGRHWHLATEYQYYAFLVWLINQLVKNGKSVEEALNMVVLDSKELGHYYDSEASTKGKYLELTGSRCVLGVGDLANSLKILTCEGGFCLCGGDYGAYGVSYPLAYLNRFTNVDYDCNSSVGLLVL